MTAARSITALLNKVTVALLVFHCALPAISAGAGPRGENEGIEPINSHPHGKSYSEWAATWWQWALQTPASTNPVLDRGPCSVGQVGSVWFLADTFSGQRVETKRSCTVPTGTALFFPLINSGWFAFLSDPPEQRTEAFVRAQVSCTQAAISAQIDGVPVNHPTQYFENSPLFEVQLPIDNVFGVDASVIPQLLLSPSVDSGYYLFVKPLEPGVHTLHWTASMTCPDLDLIQQDITYSLTVAQSPGRHRP